MYSSSVSSSWRRIKTRNRLIGSKCDKCKAVFYPEKNICSCGNDKLSEFKFKGNGKIISFSEIRAPPVNFEKQVPYIIAIIKLDEGPMLTAQVVDFDKVERGIKVEACLRRIYCSGETGIIHYGLKFRPLK
jgi:uncharacterized OB-fold protein